MGHAYQEDYLRKLFSGDASVLDFDAAVEAEQIEYAEFEVISEEAVPQLEYRGISTVVEYEWPIREKRSSSNEALRQHH